MQLSIRNPAKRHHHQILCEIVCHEQGSGIADESLKDDRQCLQGDCCLCFNGRGGKHNGRVTLTYGNRVVITLTLTTASDGRLLQEVVFVRADGTIFSLNSDGRLKIQKPIPRSHCSHQPAANLVNKSRRIYRCDVTYCEGPDSAGKRIRNPSQWKHDPQSL